MDSRQRFESLQETLIAALQGFQASLWTAIPGIVQSFNPAKMTAEVQPAVRARLAQKDGSVEVVALPLLVDCPVIFPGAGGYLMTFPMKADDEVLIILASRCIDGWWQYGGVQVAPDLRMHDLSDGFVIPGAYSRPRVPAAFNTQSAELRTADGTTRVIVSDAGGGFVDIETAGPCIINAAGGIFLNGIKWDTHAHVGVQTGSGTSGGPV